MKYKCSCLYCGYTWEETFWGNVTPDRMRCSKCHETKYLQAKPLDEEFGKDIFGYRFSPPFPKTN